MPNIKLLDGKEISFEKSINGFELVKKISKSLEKAALINSGSFQYHFQLGDLYYKKGNFSKAIISLEKALALDDSNTQTYTNLSACYAEENNFFSWDASYQFSGLVWHHSFVPSPSA